MSTSEAEPAPRSRWKSFSKELKRRVFCCTSIDCSRCVGESDSYYERTGAEPPPHPFFRHYYFPIPPRNSFEMALFKERILYRKSGLYEHPVINICMGFKSCELQTRETFCFCKVRNSLKFCRANPGEYYVLDRFEDCDMALDRDAADFFIKLHCRHAFSLRRHRLEMARRRMIFTKAPAVGLERIERPGHIDDAIPALGPMAMWQFIVGQRLPARQIVAARAAGARPGMPARPFRFRRIAPPPRITIRAEQIELQTREIPDHQHRHNVPSPAMIGFVYPSAVVSSPHIHLSGDGVDDPAVDIELLIAEIVEQVNVIIGDMAQLNGVDDEEDEDYPEILFEELPLPTFEQQVAYDVASADEVINCKSNDSEDDSIDDDALTPDVTSNCDAACTADENSHGSQEETRDHQIPRRSNLETTSRSHSSDVSADQCENLNGSQGREHSDSIEPPFDQNPATISDTQTGNPPPSHAGYLNVAVVPRDVAEVIHSIVTEICDNALNNSNANQSAALSHHSAKVDTVDALSLPRSLFSMNVHSLYRSYWRRRKLLQRRRKQKKRIGQRMKRKLLKLKS